MAIASTLLRAMPYSFAFFQTTSSFFCFFQKTKGKLALTLIIEDNNIISGRKVVKRFFKKTFCLKHSFSCLRRICHAFF